MRRWIIERKEVEKARRRLKSKGAERVAATHETRRL